MNFQLYRRDKRPFVNLVCIRLYVCIFLGFGRCVMNLRMLWKREGILWTIMAVISFLSDGLIVWLYSKLITPFCMTVWAEGMSALFAVVECWFCNSIVYFRLSALTFFISVTEGTKNQSYPTMSNVKSFKFCLRKLKKVTWRTKLLHWKAILLKTLVEMLQLWQIGSGIGPSQ